MDHAQRALVQRLPGLRLRGARAGPDRTGRHPARRPPPEPGARAGHAGAALGAARAPLGRGQSQLPGDPAADAEPGGPGRGAADRRPRQRGLPRPDPARRVPGHAAGGHVVGHRLVVRPRRGPGGHPPAPGRAGPQLLHAGAGLLARVRAERPARGRPRDERALAVAGLGGRGVPPDAGRAHRDGLDGRAVGPVRPDHALLPRGPGAPVVRDGERRGLRRQARRRRPGPRPRARRLSARPSRRGEPRDRRRGRRARLLPVVPHGQLRVGVRLRQAVRRGVRGLRDPGAHPQVERPLVRARGTDRGAAPGGGRLRERAAFRRSGRAVRSGGRPMGQPMSAGPGPGPAA
ncbi:hypothetical protein SGPA1_30218 [Streptomyces misionensis JCM 4497]